MLVFGLLLLAVSRIYGKKVKKLHKECQEADGKAKSFTQEALENWTMIQAFEGDGYVRSRLDDRLKTYFNAFVRRNRWSSASHGVMHLLFSGSYYAALAWGAVRLAANTISYGTLTAFLQIVGQIRMPFMNMSGLLPQYYNMLASAERLIELEDLPDEPRTSAFDVKSTLFEALEVADVHFAYEAEHPILTGATQTVHRGEFVALSGYSGIGKSTLFKLMLGFYEPQSGALAAVTADGRYPLGASTRALFAYVPQQSILLSGTIRENIAFCCPDATEESIWAAAETAAIAEVIRSLPDGLDTPLGERGAGLSEGQIQRLAIARAVLCDAPILLLDEVAASLD
jgi:ATP-binding cassette subfamily B protein